MIASRTNFCLKNHSILASNKWPVPMRANTKWFLARWDVSAFDELKEFIFAWDDQSSTFSNSLGIDEDQIFNLDLRPDEKLRLKEIRHHSCQDCHGSFAQVSLCEARRLFLQSLTPIARSAYYNCGLTYALYFVEKNSIVKTLWSNETNKFVSVEAAYSNILDNENLPPVASLKDVIEADAIKFRRKVLFCQFSQGTCKWLEETCMSLDDPTVSLYYCRIEEIELPSSKDKNPLKHIFDSSLWDIVVLQIPKDGRILLNDVNGRLGWWSACAKSNLKKSRNAKLNLSLIIKDDPYANDSDFDELISSHASESIFFDDTAENIFADGIFSINSKVLPHSRRHLSWTEKLSRPKVQRLQNWDAIFNWNSSKTPITSVFIADQAKTITISHKGVY